MAYTCLFLIVKARSRKENVMSRMIHIIQNATSSRRRLITTVAIILLSIVLVTICMQIVTAQMIAPPGLRVLDFLWRTLR